MIGGERLAEVRARHTLLAAGLDADTPLVRAESLTNEVWLTPSWVVRVNRRPDRRLAREAELLRQLPPEVLAPTVVEAGSRDAWDWMITERVRGVVLSRCWDSMTESARRQAVHEIGAAMKALHSVPADVVPAGLVAEPPQALAGADPLAKVTVLLEQASSLPHVPPELLGQLHGIVEAARPHLTPWPASHLVHGDLHFENVVWDGRVSAIVDFEWCRPGPCDLDLDIFLRFCSQPMLHVAADYAYDPPNIDVAEVSGWLAEAYPELFELPVERLRFYALAYDLKALVERPPDRPMRALGRHHPLRRLHELAGGRSHVEHRP